MGKTFNVGMVVGRFQPFHRGHLELIKMAAKLCETVVVVVGSAQANGTSNNPFTFEFRKQMIEKVFEKEGIYGSCYPVIIGLPDLNNPDNHSPKWGKYLLSNVEEHLETLSFVKSKKVDVVFYGNENNRSKWYNAEMRKTLSEVLVSRNRINISATEIREELIKEKPNYRKLRRDLCGINIQYIKKMETILKEIEFKHKDIMRGLMIRKRMGEHLSEVKKLGYTPVGVFLQGSQNYNLDIYNDEYQSDVDVKVIVLPSFEDIIRGVEPVSTTHVVENNEHIEIKDIRIMNKMFLKQNNSYIEILYTKYFILNPEFKEIFSEVLESRDIISRYNKVAAVKCLYGTSLEKRKALQHPYPSTVEKIEKFGYDPKQLHHILRIKDLITKYVNDEPYEKCLIPDDVEYLKEVKLGIIPEEEAIKLADQTVAEIKEITDNFIKELGEDYNPDNCAVELLNEVTETLLREYFKDILSLFKEG